MRTRGTQYVPPEREVHVIGHCGACGVEIHEVIHGDFGTSMDRFIAGKWYTCGVCGGRWQA